MAINDILIKLAADSSGLVTGVTQANGALGKLENAANRAKSAVSSLGVGLSITAFVATTTAAMRYANQLVDVAAANNLTVGSVIQLSDALAASGGSADNASLFLSSFTNYLDQAAKGSKDAQDSFTGVGISLNNLANLGADELFRSAVEQISKIEDPLKRNALAMDMFSKSAKGVDFIGLNNSLKSSSRISAEQEAQIKASAAAWNKLSQSGRDFQLSVASVTGPALQAVIDYFDKIVGKDALLGAFKTIFETIAILAANVGFVITSMVNDIKGLMEAAQAFAGKGGMSGAKAILNLTAEEGRRRRSELDLIEQRIRGTAVLIKDKALFEALDKDKAGRVIAPSKGTKTAEQILKEKIAIQDAEFAFAMETEDKRQAMELANIHQTEAEKQVAHDAFIDRQAAEDAILGSKWDKENEQINKLAASAKDLYDQTRTPLENLNIEFERLNGLLNAGVIDWDTYARATMNAQDQFATATDAMKDDSLALKKTMEDMGRTFTNYFANMLTGTKQASMSFSDMARSIVADILKMQIQKRITDPLVKAGTKILDNLIGGLFATGGVPGGTGLSNYRNKVVDKPTLFAFASGAGLMGEAGPEAIMPLTRTSGGDLGVKVQGDQATNVHVTYNIQSWDSRDTLQAIYSSAPQIVGIVQQAFNKRGRSGPMG